MSESGGPATQAGIFYQNSISALYLGMMCNVVARPDVERVTAVRVEAPTEVDDTVVTFADDHRIFIQAKDSVSVGSRPWVKLWEDFVQEFQNEGFRRGEDCLQLCLGEPREQYRTLQAVCERAKDSRDHSEWWERLTGPQRALVERIGPLTGSLPAEAEMLSFFSHVSIRMWSLEHIEEDLVRYRMPDSSVSKQTLFRLLRDRVGGKARRRGWFTAADLRESLQVHDGVSLGVPLDLEELSASVAACGNLLKQHKHTYSDTGQHLEREVVDNIVGWALESPEENNMAVLLDAAGMGKTVVMRDVLRRLEDADTPVLALKADVQLSGISSREELQQRLDFPEPIERTVGRLSTLSRVVVLIDQIDALSLSMAQDEETLNIVLELVAALRAKPGVRILISCRAFDLKNDPRLERVEMRRSFQLQQLSDEEIETVLSPQGVALDDLSRATRELLRTPLHLDLFSRILARGSSAQAHHGAHGVSTLQELYALLWRKAVVIGAPGAPRASEREEVLHILTERMDREQRISVPRSVFDRPDTEHLAAAANWLASAGILVASDTDWSFLHQTFFDYCYARRFVEGGGQISEVVLAGDQGLFARSQLVQVLSYLRGSDHRAYLHELNTLLHAESLRVHLRTLLLGWFGSLRAPGDDEWLLARRLLIEPELRPRLLTAMQGNPEWFARLVAEGKLRELLAEQDQVLDTEVFPYLSSMAELEQSTVIEIIEPFLGRSEHWDLRIRWVLDRIREWNSVNAVILLGRIIEDRPLVELGRTYQLRRAFEAFLVQGLQSLRSILDRILDAYRSVAAEQTTTRRGLLDEVALEDADLDGIIKAVSAADSEVFVEHMLPWLEGAARRTAVDEPDGDWPYFALDGLSPSLYAGRSSSARETIIKTMTDALSSLAREAPEAFSTWAEDLATLPYRTTQELLAETYRGAPESYAGDALNFLLGDRRRLQLGREQYRTRQLIKAIYPLLSSAEKHSLEDYILSYNTVFSFRGLQGLHMRGLEQLRLLQQFPVEDLSYRGAAYLRELERKFPGYRASDDPPARYWVSAVGPPIPASAAENMSDGAWLRAMQKYSGAVRHSDFDKGGAYQLGSVLKQCVKEEPVRFHALALQAPSDVDDEYVRAFVEGLAESTCRDERLLEVAKRFINLREGNVIRLIAWALEKRAEGGLDDEMLDLLENIVRGPVDEDEERWSDSWDSAYGAHINSKRGTSFNTLMLALQARTNTETLERRWALLEFSADDYSTPMRAGAIEQLVYLLYEDRARSITLFENAVKGRQALICSEPTVRFLRYGSYKAFLRTEPFIRSMIENADEECCQRGAELACIADVSSAEALGSQEALSAARRLAQEASEGPEATRRGAARVYAHNMDGVRAAFCAEKLSRFLNDDSEQVRMEATRAIDDAPGIHSAELREFVESFAASAALHEGAHELADYLWQHGTDDPAWALSVLETITTNSQESRSPYPRSADKLVRLALRIYTDPIADSNLKERAMDVFDRLMEQHKYEAQRTLDEWDRR